MVTCTVSVGLEVRTKKKKRKGMQEQKGCFGSMLTLICYMFIFGVTFALLLFLLT